MLSTSYPNYLIWFYSIAESRTKIYRFQYYRPKKKPFIISIHKKQDRKLGDTWKKYLTNPKNMIIYHCMGCLKLSNWLTINFLLHKLHNTCCYPITSAILITSCTFILCKYLTNKTKSLCSKSIIMLQILLNGLINIYQKSIAFDEKIYKNCMINFFLRNSQD